MQVQRREGERCGAVIRGIVAREALMQHGTQAIDLGAWCCVRLAILLWCGIACGAERDGIFRLPRFEVSCNAKVDEERLLMICSHHITGLEVAKDNWWLASMQIFQHHTQLNTNRDCFAD